jgi:amino acid transporter
VCYGFVRLAGRVGHAGSVYAFVGSTLGPRAGFVAGWALLGTYLVFPAVSISAVAVFGRAFLDAAGIADSASWLPLALGGAAVIWFLASREIRVAARSLLAFEGVSLVLILALVVVIFATLAFGDAPRGQGITGDWVNIPPGTGFSTVALAATFGFLSFAGFESAGSLGEEAERPTWAIPRSIVVAVALGAVLYVVCMVAQTLGFGTDRAGTRAFAGSQAPLGDLARDYVGSGMAAALDLAAVISALGAGLGCASVAARMLYALARDGLLVPVLSGVSASTGAPAAGLAFVMLLDIGGLVAFAAAGTAPIDVFFYLATIGTLSLLVMYAVTNVAAMRLLAGGARRWELVLPVAGILVAGYVLYRNVWPVPEAPFDVFPYVVAAWLGIGVAVAIAVPRVGTRTGIAG